MELSAPPLRPELVQAALAAVPSWPLPDRSGRTVPDVWSKEYAATRPGSGADARARSAPATVSAAAIARSTRGNRAARTPEQAERTPHILCNSPFASASAQPAKV